MGKRKDGLTLWTAAAALLMSLGAGLAGAQAPPSLTILAPRGTPARVDREQISVVGRTDPAAATTATIAGVDVPVLRTGIFVRDGVPVALGSNDVPVTLLSASGTTVAQTTVQVTRVEPAPPPSPVLPSRPLVIDPKSIEPAQNVALAPGELLEVSFRGASGNKAEFQLDALPWTAMEEVRDPVTGEPTGVYRATITVPELAAGVATDETSQPITVRLSPVVTADERREGNVPAPVLAQSPGRIAVWRHGGPARLLRVSDPVGLIRYGLTEVRLGGPYLAEAPRGTVLRAVGRRGPFYRVQLTPGLSAWIHASEVEPAPAGTPVPHLEFTGMTLFTTEGGDEVITIPYTAPVPFSVTSEGGTAASRPGALNIDLYGAHQAVTWITHRNPSGLIGQITAQQNATDHLRLRAELTSGPLWGYRTEMTTGALKIHVRRPPAPLAPGTTRPLAGLRVAVNAGHGGREAGARGLSGAREADVTLAVSRLVAEELAAAGAQPVMIRQDDVSLPTGRRAPLAMEAGADLFVSIHCNSGGTSAGYLVTSGTSTYYKHAYNHELADTVRRKIVERTQLANFGTVGNFNYSPIRMMTWMPAILVETAFISNPAEEARLTDPAFRKQMAIAIREGLEEYVGAHRPKAEAPPPVSR